MHGKGLPQSVSFAQDYYNRELAGKPKGIKRVLKSAGCCQNEVWCCSVQPLTIDQAATKRVTTVLVEFVRQGGTCRIRKGPAGRG